MTEKNFEIRIKKFIIGQISINKFLPSLKMFLKKNAKKSSIKIPKKVYKKVYYHPLNLLFFPVIYSFTNSLDKAIEIKKEIDIIVKEVYLLDYYYETGNKEYKKIALKIRKKIDNKKIIKLLDEYQKFFEYEKKIAKKMKENHKFSEKDIKKFHSKKAGDSYIYFNIIKLNLNEISKNYKLISNNWHYTLCLFDILDDYNDVMEDVAGDNPNSLILCALKKKKYSQIKKMNEKQIFEAAKPNIKILKNVVEYFIHQIKPTSKKFSFLRGIYQDLYNKLNQRIKP